MVWMVRKLTVQGFDFKLVRFETKLISCDDKENVAFSAEIDASLIVAPS